MAKANGTKTAPENRVSKEHDADKELGALDLSVELGVTGLRVSSGQVQDQQLRQLRGHHRRWLTIFEEMARYDDVIGGMLYAVEMLIRQLKWRTEPGGTSMQDLEVAEFVDTLRNDMSSTWEDTIAEILSMIWAGFSYHEIVYKRRDGFDAMGPGHSSRFSDGMIGWRKLPIRAQSSLIRWIFDEAGGTRAMVQRNPNPSSGHSFQTEIVIPIEKALLFRPKSNKGSPEGRSLLETSFISWYYKKKLTTIEAIGVERDLAGIPILWVPPKILASNATATDQQTLLTMKEMAVNVRNDEQGAILMPLAYDGDGNKIYDFDLMTSGGTKQIDPDVPIMRHNHGMVAAVMAQFILMGDGDGGSFAMHKDKTELFLVGLGTIAREIKSVFNRHAIPRVLALNGISVENPPRYEHDDIQHIDLAVLGEFLGKMTAAGAPLFPDTELENVLREAASLPLAPEESTL